MQFNWTPSTARVVVIEGFGAAPRGGSCAPPLPLVWPEKDPSDVLDYVVDVSEAVAGNEGDAIASFSVQIAPAQSGGLALQSSAAEGLQAILWLSQGLAGTTYGVTVVITTNSGRVISRTIELPVAALSSVSPPLNAIVDGNGAAITDQTGAALTTS